MPESNVPLLRSLYAAFASGDAPSVFARMDPAIVWTEAENFPYADRNPYIGPDAVAEGIFMRLATEWDNFEARPHEFLDAGDTVVVLGYYEGTYKATGKHLLAQFVHVWRVRDGKLAAFQQFVDTAQAVQVMQA